MDRETKKRGLDMAEDIMKLSLHYCKDPNDEIRDYSMKVNNIAHELKILLERYGD